MQSTHDLDRSSAERQRHRWVEVGTALAKPASARRRRRYDWAVRSRIWWCDDKFGAAEQRRHRPLSNWQRLACESHRCRPARFVPFTTLDDSKHGEVALRSEELARGQIAERRDIAVAVSVVGHHVGVQRLCVDSSGAVCAGIGWKRGHSFNHALRSAVQS